MTNPTTRNGTYEHPSFDNGCLMIMVISKKTKSFNLFFFHSWIITPCYSGLIIRNVRKPTPYNRCPHPTTEKIS